MSGYAGQQFVGIDLHRRRSVVVRTTESGGVLESMATSGMTYGFQGRLICANPALGKESCSWSARLRLRRCRRWMTRHGVAAGGFAVIEGNAAIDKISLLCEGARSPARRGCECSPPAAASPRRGDRRHRCQAAEDPADRVRRAHRERAAGGTARRRRDEQQGDRANPVRHGQDGRGASEPRLSQTRDQLPPAAGQGPTHSGTGPGACFRLGFTRPPLRRAAETRGARLGSPPRRIRSSATHSPEMRTSGAEQTNTQAPHTTEPTPVARCAAHRTSPDEGARVGPASSPDGSASLRSPGHDASVRPGTTPPAGGSTQPVPPYRR